MNKMKTNCYSIVIGCSRFGANVAASLSQEGHDVIVIDESKTAFRKLSSSFTGFQFEGDGTDIDVLIESGIKNSHLVIAATDDDNVNIMIASIAYHIFKTKTVIARINDTDKEMLLNETNIQVIRPSKLSIDEFFRISALNQLEVV